MPPGAASASWAAMGPARWSRAASKPKSASSLFILSGPPAEPITFAAPSVRASCPATLPTAPAAAETKTTSPSRTGATSVSAAYAVRPVVPSGPRYAWTGASPVSTTVAASASSTAYSRQPRKCETVAPTGTSADREAITSPTAAPSSGAPSSNGGRTGEGTSSIRPRMYGSTDIHVLRTRMCPSPGSGTAATASAKSVGAGSPTGRAARRISRPVRVLCEVIGTPIGGVSVDGPTLLNGALDLLRVGCR